MPDNSFSAFDFVSPLDARYYGNDAEVFGALHPFLSEGATLRYQLKVEQALVAELEASGIAPSGMSALVAEAVEQISPAEIYAEEERIRHVVRALVHSIQLRLPEEMRGYVHLFATSNDITDTARAVAMRDVTREVLFPDLRDLIKDIISLAQQYAETLQIGRTHGRHAEPITVGYWLANYVARLGQRAELIAKTASDLRGKFSGAVGAHNALAVKWPDDPTVMERQLLNRLGLRPSDHCVSTQTVNPEYLIDFGHALVSTFSVLANMADDLRHLMRSEIEEIGQKPDANRVGSSTMPHKVNPTDFENVKSLWKAFMPRMVTMYMDQISEHQRDLTSSASMRFFNELVAGFDYAVRRLRKAIRSTEINPVAIERHLRESSQWTIAEPLYIALAIDGHADPYGASRSLTLRAREGGEDLLSFLKSDSEAQQLLEQLSPTHREIVLDPSLYTGDAPALTRLVCEAWETRLSSGKLTTDLARPPEDEALIYRHEGAEATIEGKETQAGSAGH